MRDRVEYHKDKIISPTIYEELCGLEVKKSGKIEHSDNTHDDQIFSWLWALYMYYNGTDLMNNWGIVRRVLKTDADLEEVVYDVNSPTQNITTDVEVIDDPEVQSQLEILNSSPGAMSFKEWREQEYQKDQESLARLLQTKAGRDAYNEHYHVDTTGDDGSPAQTMTSIPNEVFDNFYMDPDMEGFYDPNVGNLNQMRFDTSMADMSTSIISGGIW